MGSSLVLILWVLLTVLLLREDKKTFQTVPATVWLPVIYCFILASRLPSQWTAQSFGGSFSGYEEGSPLDRAVYLTLLVASSWVLWRRPDGFRKLFWNNWPLTVYLIYTLTSVAWSDFPLIGLKRWVRDLGIYFTIGVVISDPDVDSAVRLLFRRLAYLALPLSTVVIKYFPNLSRGFDPWSGQGYNFGVATSKNGLGAISLICGLSLLWDCLADHRNSRRSFRVVLVNMALLGNALWLLMISSSATSLLCFVFGSILLAMMYLSRRFMSPRTVSWVFVLGLIAYIPADYFLNLTEVVVRGAGRDTTFTGRTDVWAEVLEVADAPVFGAGYESFWLGDRLAHMWRVFFWGPTQAHNGYLEVYINLGFIGVLVVLGLLCFFYLRIIRSLTHDPSYGRLAMCLFAVFVFYNMTEAAIRSSLPWYALLVAVLGLSPRTGERPAGARGSKVPVRREFDGPLRNAPAGPPSRRVFRRCSLRYPLT